MSVINKKLIELLEQKVLVKIDIAGEAPRYGFITNFSEELLCLARMSKRGSHEGLEVITLTGDEIISWGSQELAGIEDMFIARNAQIEDIKVPAQSQCEALEWCKNEEVRVVLRLTDGNEIAGSVLSVDELYLEFDALDYHSLSTQTVLVPCGAISSFMSFDCEIEDSVFAEKTLEDEAY